MNPQMTYPSRKLDVQEVDVLVAGGGPAGAAAAIAAAREGARTLLVEQGACLGGLGTSGLVPCWVPLTDGRDLVVKGLAVRIVDEMKSHMPHVPADRYEWVPIDAEVLKRVYDRRLTESGASVLFHTQFVDALARAAAGRSRSPKSTRTAPRRKVAAAVICNKAGLSAVRARYFIDCTGDGDLAVRAGADCEKGDERTGKLQPATPCFLMAGIDTEKLFAWREERPDRQNVRDAVARAKAAGDLDIPEAHITSFNPVSPCTVGFNFSHLFDIDGSDPWQLSAGQMAGRRLAEHLANFVRKYCPGCEQAVLTSTGLLGIRETRRIVGEYRLTARDYHARRSFPDEIARNAYYLDVHWDRAGQQRYAAGRLDWRADFKPYAPGESHGIPLGCLIPRKLANVLVAGRCISTDRPVNGAVRCMAYCVATGEAAGCAAGLAVAADVRDIRDLDVQALRSRLREHGVHFQ